MRDLKNKLIGLTLLFVSGLFILKYMNVIEVSNTDIMLYGFFIVILTNDFLFDMNLKYYLLKSQ